MLTCAQTFEEYIKVSSPSSYADAVIYDVLAKVFAKLCNAHELLKYVSISSHYPHRRSVFVLASAKAGGGTCGRKIAQPGVLDQGSRADIGQLVEAASGPTSSARDYDCVHRTGALGRSGHGGNGN
jgi:hypothetical protein